MNHDDLAHITGIVIPDLSLIPQNRIVTYINPENNLIEITSICYIFSFNHFPLINYGDNETNDFEYYSLPLFEDLNILPFAEDGGGYFFCFRKIKDFLEPQIVLWIRDNEPGKDVSFLANSFDEFLSMLKSEDEIDALLNEEEKTP